MAKTNIAQIPAKLYELLEPLDSDGRAKVIQATLILFGDAPLASTFKRKDDDGQNGMSNSDKEGSVRDPKSFFEHKNPQNKGEELAVAARYRELKEDVHVHNKEELTKVFTDARRNFDSSNYSRDIKNARNQAGFFNKGTGKNSEKLSYFGQNYVDELPNRDAAKKLRRPVKKSTKKKTKSSKAKAKK